MKKRKKPKVHRNAMARQKVKAQAEIQELFYKAIQLGNQDVVEKLMPHAELMADEGLALLIAFEQGNADIFQRLFAQLDDAQIYWNILLCGMAKLGFCKDHEGLAEVAETYGGEIERAYHEASDEFDFLLTLANPAAWNHYALRCAAEHGHLHLVKRFLPISNARAGDSGALRMAAHNGHVEVVKALLPVSDPKAVESDALRRAAYSGYLEVLDLLIPLSDPKAKRSFALAQAALAGHAVMVERLWAISDPAEALVTLEDDGDGGSKGAAMIRDRLSAERQHAELAKATLTPETRDRSQPRL